MQQEWLASLDTRTRHSHRRVDGERVAVGEKFSNGCRWPGDPNAPYSEVMNCRCTLVAALDGVEDSAQERFSRLPEGMTYEQWKSGKVISVRGSEGDTDYVFSEHALERAKERNVGLDQAIDAIVSPLHEMPTEIRNGEPAKKVYGNKATVVCNPKTNVIITTYPTGKKWRSKYGEST